MELTRAMRAAVEASSFGIVVTDNRREDNPIVFANSAFTILTGYSDEEILGRNCRFLQGPDSDSATVGRIREAVATGGSFDDRLLNYRKNGSRFWNRLVINPALDDSGDISGFIGIQEDVTALKTLTDEREALLERLEAFSGTAAHDLRAPLRQIRQFLELHQAMIGAGNEAKATEHAKNARAAAQRAEELVEAILNHARAGRRGLEQERVELTDVVEGVVETLAPKVRDLGADVQVEPLPAVLGHSIEIQQVFQNLIANSLAFAAPERAPRVKIAATTVERWADVAVSDNGRGISADHQRDVFQAFRRAPNSTHVEGSGLGLAIVRRAMESLGGGVSLESTEGQGTTVQLRFLQADAGEP